MVGLLGSTRVGSREVGEGSGRSVREGGRAGEGAATPRYGWLLATRLECVRVSVCASACWGLVDKVAQGSGNQWG